MENLPFYIPAVFIAATMLTLYFLYKASHHSKIVLLISLAWLSLQAVIGLSEFYAVTNALPPRLLLNVLPPLLFISLCFSTKRGIKFLKNFDVKWLTALHVVRIPVEMVLLWLSIQKFVPDLMTFEGRNFDILSGLTAPFIFYFGYIRKTLNPKVLLGWNFICLALLFNIVMNAILAAPFPFQQFAFEQPNIAVLYFPFVWLPAFIVPAVLFSHLVCIKQLLAKKKALNTSADFIAVV